MESFEVVLLAMRVWLGVVMIAHGLNHARNLQGTASWFASKGFRYELLNARASGVVEIAVGTGLIVGLLTSLAAAGLAATMVVAYGAIHRFAGFFVFARPDEGYEYVVTLVVAALAVGTLGPGTLSVDSAIGLVDAFDGWTGLLIVVGGVLAGVGQLALFWRPPSQSQESIDKKEVQA